MAKKNKQSDLPIGPTPLEEFYEELDNAAITVVEDNLSFLMNVVGEGIESLEIDKKCMPFTVKWAISFFGDYCSLEVTRPDRK